MTGNFQVVIRAFESQSEICVFNFSDKACKIRNTTSYINFNFSFKNDLEKVFIDWQVIIHGLGNTLRNFSPRLVLPDLWHSLLVELPPKDQSAHCYLHKKVSR